MGKIIFRGKQGSKAVIGGRILIPDEELMMPFGAISEGIINSEDYEVYDDEGKRVSGKPKAEEPEESEDEEKDNKARVGKTRSSSKKKKKE